MGKDKLVYSEIDNPSDVKLQQFSDFFNSFAREKNLPPCNFDKLKSVRDIKALVMTYVTDNNNKILCASIFIVDQVNKQLYWLYGASDRLTRTTKEEQALVGRANKLLHWKGIESAIERGMNWYNFGGEVIRKGDEGVNDFKRRIGTMNGNDKFIYIPKTMLGRLCVTYLYYRWKKNYQFHYNAQKSSMPY